MHSYLFVFYSYFFSIFPQSCTYFIFFFSFPALYAEFSPLRADKRSILFYSVLLKHRLLCEESVWRMRRAACLVFLILTCSTWLTCAGSLEEEEESEPVQLDF